MNPYFIVLLAEINRCYDLWKELPIEIYYAVKCNPSPILLEYIASLGIKFDCASKKEIEEVLKISPASSIVYANPCKSIDHIQYAKEHEVPLLVFDSDCELDKIKEYYPKCQLLLRIWVKNTTGSPLSKKFGAKNALPLLKRAQELELNVVGISFHVGSPCTEPSLYYDALKQCHDIIKVAPYLEVIDIGGGFKLDNFQECAAEVRRGMELLPGKRFIAEVGRFLVETSHTLYVQVICKKKEGNQRIYYINDGVYGSFNCKLLDHATPILKTIKQGELFSSTVYGPTCDSIDIVDECHLPELDVGDTIFIEKMGAYTNASSSPFNGFEVTDFIYVSTI